MIRLIVILIFIFFEVSLTFAQSTEFKGQASGWLQCGKDEKENAALGLRYIPEFKWQQSVTPQTLIDMELSLNMFGSYLLRSAAHPDHYSAIKPYRMWLRYSGEQFELRVGLQKINFGPARILRSLRWFDRVDPRDPLQITDGVYGLLGRYYFLNNANIWAWGLYGNEEPKGLEFLSTVKENPEWGGRLQYPLPRGEFGLTIHQRQAEEPISQNRIHSAPEYRFACDGSWDLGVALWFEAIVIKSEYLEMENQWQKFITMGSDYTFEWRNGFHITAEHFVADQSVKAEKWQNRFDFSALMFDYMLNIMDRVNLVVFYNHNLKDWYNYAGWQRTYDNWMINLSAFWNPVRAELFESRQTLLAGKGVQVMVVFNH